MTEFGQNMEGGGNMLGRILSSPISALGRSSLAMGLEVMNIGMGNIGNKFN